MRFVLIVHAAPGTDHNHITGRRFHEGKVELTPASQLELTGRPNYQLRLDGMVLGSVAALIRDFTDELPPSAIEEVS